MKKISVLFFIMFSCLNMSSSFADTIYLQESPKGNQGRVLEEYPDFIVIKFPKSEIKRIEASERPDIKQSSLPQIIWVDDGETITLRLPKASVQISGDVDLQKNMQRVSQSSSFGKNPVVARIQDMMRSTDDRFIQGKVLLKGAPLGRCDIRIVKIMDASKDKLLELFSSSKDKDKKKVFETTTDEYGLYTFSNIPYGEYILYWKPAGNKSWIRRLSENPDISLIPGRPVAVRNIEANIKTVN